MSVSTFLFLKWVVICSTLKIIPKYFYQSIKMTGYGLQCNSCLIYQFSTMALQQVLKLFLFCDLAGKILVIKVFSRLKRVGNTQRHKNSTCLRHQSPKYVIKKKKLFFTSENITKYTCTQICNVNVCILTQYVNNAFCINLVNNTTVRNKTHKPFVTNVSER